LIDSVFQAPERFFAFLARELAPSRRRINEAARTAIKSALTAGLAATMQVLGPFGPLFAFRIGQPGISLGIFEGALIIVCAAVMQAAIVPITGKLLDYPGLIMAFLFIVFAAIGYLLSNTKLFLILALVAVGTITTVYVGIFEPGRIGWGSTYTFDGILVATLVMVALDTAVWPSPPEPRLIESIAVDFEHTRSRLELVGRHYLDPSAASLPPAQVTSKLARNLALLKSVKEQSNPAPEHFAALLDAIMSAEHIYLEVEHLAVLADEPIADVVRQNRRAEIAIALNALDTALAQRANNILAAPAGGASSQWASEFGDAMQELSKSTAQRLSVGDESTGSGLPHFLEFVSALQVIANLLEPRNRLVDSAAEPERVEDELEPRPLFDPDAFRFSIKLGAAITLGLLVGLTTQRADLQTILWSIAVAGQPNQYGAILRKTMLRLTGCIVGGIATLGAMLIVSENFDSLPAYLAAIFAVTMFCTYVAQSGEWLGYAGIQAGITFLVCYVGLGPSSNIYTPLWRFWGIVLGVLTTALVFLVLWPEYASDKLAQRLAELVRTTLAFGRQVAGGKISEPMIAAAERSLSSKLLEALDMADQARLEGRRGRAKSAAGVDAVAAVVRIAYRFRIIARGRLSGSDAKLSRDVRESCRALEQGYCSGLETVLEKLEKRGDFHSSVAAPLPLPLDFPAPVIDEFAPGGMPEGARWSAAETNLVAQLESYRRMPILLESLDAAVSTIADT
jgi:uncharacterized membrane protein YccC